MAGAPETSGPGVSPTYAAPRMSSYELEVRAGEGNELVQVDVSGELDLTNARELELRLDEVAPADVRLVVDISHVSFIDSAALHVLFKLARRRGPTRLAIVVEPTSQVASTLAIVGLDSVATLCSSLEALPPPGNSSS